MVKWIEPQPIDVPDALWQVASLKGNHPLLAELLVRRGITDLEAARGYLDPDAYAPASPEELPELNLTVARLERAIESRERIAIWGDFDVDGQTATALYFEALRTLGADVTHRIPTRRESHGVHPAGVQRLIDEGCRLILTADTGVAALEAVSLATDQGADVLVTDHHDLPPTLPPALALVNPKRLPSDHPLYELPGVGVAYQVIYALCKRMGRGPDERYLDLVALGIVADVATLRADVRYLLQRGLDALRHTERLGLKAMMELANLNPALLTEEEIAFTLAPRLNALSRVGEELATSAGVELLTTGDRTQARTIATSLEALNARRRWLTRETTDAAMAQLERDRTLRDGPAIVVSGEDWDPGIVGIVAGRLSEHFNLPAIVISAPPGEMARGSARSVEGVDIHAAIAVQRHMLYRCGGHPMAAGLSLERERIGEFRRALWRTLEETSALPAEPEVAIDAYLTLDQISVDVVKAIQPLSPFGPGNEAPVFASRDLSLVSNAIIGRTREHRRLVVRDLKESQQTVLWWRSADQSAPESRFDLAYTLSINAFRGQEHVQLTWVAARPIAPVPAQVMPRPEIAVRDFRGLTEREPALRALLAGEGAQAVLVLGEGERLPAVPTYNRTTLHPTERLVIWTTPPDPNELHVALEVTSPREVVLFGVDPGLDTPRVFTHRLAGLVKYALRRRNGQADLPKLAAAMAHSESTVRLGLEWLEQKGQIEVTFDGQDQVTLRAGPGEPGDRLHVIEGRLEAELAETAAYRSYFKHASAQSLVR